MESAGGECAVKGIWRYDVNTDHAKMVHMLTPVEDKRRAFNTDYATFSPDGQSVAYTYPFVYLLDVQTDSVRQLTDHFGRQPVWSSTGETVVYAAWEERFSEARNYPYADVYGFYSVDVASGTTKELNDLPAWKPTWQPAGGTSTSGLTGLLDQIEPVDGDEASNGQYPVSDDNSEMVLIPAGEFTMGCDDANHPVLGCRGDEELPLHTVRLNSYAIDKYEVTNTRYEACVEAGVCSPPQSPGFILG